MGDVFPCSKFPSKFPSPGSRSSAPLRWGLEPWGSVRMWLPDEQQEVARPPTPGCAGHNSLLFQQSGHRLAPARHGAVLGAEV